MDVYEEMEEAKAEIEKLKVKLGDKTNTLQNIKKYYDAQVNKIQEAIFKVEKLNQEMLQKADDINDDLKESLNNKESIAKHLNAANDELGANCDDKFRKWHDEERGYVLALEEANEKLDNQEKQMHLSRQEIESMEGCFSVSYNKCLEIEKNLEASSKLGEANDMFQKLEEENMKVEEQLEWKEEHFKHLEEVHEKLIDQFKASKEWELEKPTLLDEISSLKSMLDYHKRISHDLQHQLQMCNQALAHEESLRKRLEDEVSNLNKEKEEKCFQLKQMELKDAALISSKKDISEEREQAACFMRQVESYGLANELLHLPHNEFDWHKDLHMEDGFKEQLNEVYDALDRANIELDERICEKSEMEFELRIWKSFVERLRNALEENLVMRKELENSLLAQVDFSESLAQEKENLVYKLEEKENKIECLQQHVLLFEQEPKVKETEASVPESGEIAESSENVEVRYLQIIEEKDKILEEFQKEVLSLEQESLRRELESAMIAKSNMERTNEFEKENPIQIIKGKNVRTDELMQQVTSLEQKFTNSLTSISSQLAEKQAEIIHVKEACDKITAAEVLAALEVEEKKLMLVELEYDIHDMEQKLKLKDENWRQSEQLALDIEEEMDAKQLQIKELIDQMENKLRGSDVFLQKLKIENRSLLESATRLSSERENLLGFVLGLGDKMCECTTADTQIMDTLRSMVQSFENDSLGINLKKDDELLVKENMIMHSPTGIKKLETFSDIRSPFKELDN
ncbi:uncharacterized protein At4g38062-like [Glycine soja]|uniref:Uncharacterized protein n=1 Tax=Glycine soja TaxID=3848 RepID=A0A445LXU2_GLYSO|nr:uncharacterized protein At4g38062-like [Glycine soja]RZC28121.1 hypothetical protein D0Y65_000229 [Glycine soja]